MATVTYDGGSGGYWLDNGLVKLLVKPTATLGNLTQLEAPLSGRDVAYCYPWLGYTTEAGVSGSFYLNAIGNFTLSPSASPLTTAYVDLAKTYTDANGVQHTFTIRVSLTDAARHAVSDFQDIASVGIKKLNLNIEANLYPQGYALQASGGSFNAGGNAAYTVPAPYDNSTYSFFANGLIKKDAVDQVTAPVIDAYNCCYSLDASCALFSNYAALYRLRVYTLNSGTERQWAWLDIMPEPLTKYKFKASFNFGAWASTGAASCQSAYAALPKVEALTALPAAQYNRIVRTDLNADLYDYNQKFQDILDNLSLYQPSLQGTATLVPAGTPSFKFFKDRNLHGGWGKSAWGKFGWGVDGGVNTWNATVKDLAEDFVQKSITMARGAGKRLFVEIDILDNTWNTAYPNDTAIGDDETTRFSSGGAYYWVKLKRLVTVGQSFHDAFISYATYLCENYNFYGLVISECFYKDVDYSSEAKAMFIADNPSYTDWPRSGGAIDKYNETLGKWKTQKLGILWDELKTIANANNKKFFVMVEPNFFNEERQAWEYGQYYPEAIDHADGLWFWGYYGSFGTTYSDLSKLYNKAYALKKSYPSKEFIMSIGLWDITAPDLKNGLDHLWGLHWQDVGDGLEVTPSKYMTAEHWGYLWGTMPALSSGYLSMLKQNTANANAVVEVFLDTGIKKYGFGRGNIPEITPIIQSVSSLQNKLDAKSGFSTRGNITFSITGRDNFKNMLSGEYLKNRRVVVRQGFIAPGFDYSDYAEVFAGRITDWSRKGDELTITASDDMIDASMKIPEENSTKTQYADYRNTNPVDIMKDILLTKLGIGAAYVDENAFDTERDNWLNGWRFDRVITEPKEAQDYLNELQIETNSFLVHDGMRIVFKVFAPPVPGQSIEEWTDGFNIQSRSFSEKSGYKDNFFNRVVFYFDYDESGSDKEENFESAVIALDAASQGSTQWDETKTKTIKSKWMRSFTYGQPVNITGVVLYHVSRANGAGTGYLTYNYANNTLQWTAPGGTIGEAVKLSKDGKEQVFSSDKTKWARVVVTTASLPASDKSDSIAITALNGQAYASDIAQKLLNRYRDPVATVAFDVDMNNIAWASKLIKPTDIKDITTDEACVKGGSTWVKERVMLTSVRPEKDKVSIEVIQTKMYRRYGFIAPAGTPDYDSATAAQKEYAFIGDANNKVGAALEDGYYIW